MSNLQRVVVSFTAFCFLCAGSYAQEITWANKVESFSSQKSETVFSVNQILGSPSNYPNVGFSPAAWMPDTEKDLPGEFIKVTFDKPVKAKQVIIVENYYPGNIQRIFLFDSLDRKYLVYNNTTEQSTSAEGKLFVTSLTPTKFRVHALRVEFAKISTGNLYQIDAIGITSSTGIPDLSVPVAVGSDTIQVQRLTTSVNSAIDEVYPVISPDGKTLYFDRKNHPENLGFKKNDDIWKSSILPDNTFTDAKNLGSPLNDENPNFICSISPDGNTALLGNVFLNDGTVHPGISISQKTDAGWSKPIAQTIEGFYNSGSFNEYCLSNDGNILIMTVNMSDTHGDRDIYVSFKTGKNYWSAPKNLGKKINSANEELSPFLAADNKTLYFSSNGRAGFGSHDIYMSKRTGNNWTNWTEPINLGNKINSADWDAYYTIDAKGTYAYLCSNRDAKNNVDIYRIRMPQELQPDTMLAISGRIIDRSTGKMMSAEVLYFSAPNNISGVSTTTSSSGYLFYIKPGDTLQLTITSENYYVSTAKIGPLKKDAVYDFELIPMTEGVIIEMRNILFNANSSVLLDSSYTELNKIKSFLLDNPGISIEVRGHTNGLCNDDFCNALSGRRAKSVAEYFIQSGIQAARITSKGYGKTIPVADNETPEGRQKNQRVEFMITKAE